MENYKIILITGEELIPSENFHFFYYGDNNYCIGSINELISCVLVNFELQIREWVINDHFNKIKYIGITDVFGSSKFVKRIIPITVVKEFALLKQINI